MKNVFEEMLQISKGFGLFIGFSGRESCSGYAGAKVFRSDSSGLLPLSTLKFYALFIESELTYYADSYPPRVHIGQ